MTAARQLLCPSVRSCSALTRAHITHVATPDTVFACLATSWKVRWHGADGMSVTECCAPPTILPEDVLCTVRDLCVQTMLCLCELCRGKPTAQQLCALYSRNSSVGYEPSLNTLYCAQDSMCRCWAWAAYAACYAQG
jgi:hypothetical protein